MKLKAEFCHSIVSYKRLITQEVSVGSLLIGGRHPIRVQSMTTADTMDTKKIIEESIRMINAGSELVRITTPSIKESNNLLDIKKGLNNAGYNIPLVADVHFTPNAAEVAARIVEKVRINPGNFADKKKFDFIEYTDQTYQEELERINKRFSPLVKICKEYGTAMRIGVNHGSLSDRIMSRYGDTPQGMVESAMEFIKICEYQSFHNIVVSMKSSNPQVMIHAYRLLVKEMSERSLIYPLHLGVTEAGDGEDGRIKSALGIGTLLEDGIGDTIRVSLTEPPENEIPVAKKLAEKYEYRKTKLKYYWTDGYSKNPYEYNKRETLGVENIGGDQVPRVILDFVSQEVYQAKALEEFGFRYQELLDKYNIDDTAVDYIYWGKQIPNYSLPGNLKSIYDFDIWNTLTDKYNAVPLLDIYQWTQNPLLCQSSMHFLSISPKDFNDELFLNQLRKSKFTVLVLETLEGSVFSSIRQIHFKLEKEAISCPIIIKIKYSSISSEELTIFSAIDLGSSLVNGVGNGVWLSTDSVSIKDEKQLCFNILQASRTRISKTEYISCPSCGRTLFDLQETTQKIRERTEHLKGVKIGIMGCIVNGPGEMADADYGYVGTGPDKITLYRGKEVCLKNVQTRDAVDKLIELIKEDKKWVEND